jgi:type IV fimbrial biogenesis protein FimT
MRCKISARGITLVEVMAVLTIATLLGAVGVPLFGSLLQRYRLSTTVNDFLSAIHFTRAEALRRGGPVQLIPADGVHWSSGWIVLRDLNDNQRADPGEEIIARYGPAPSGLVITNAFGSAKGHYLAYSGSGRTSLASGDGAHFGRFRIASSAGQRLIVINALGRARACTAVGVDDTTC